MEFLLLIPSLILAYLLWDEKHSIRTEREKVEAARGVERAEWTQERRQLLNRIQRPDIAVAEDFEPSLEQPYVPFDDDQAFWESRN